MKINAIPLDQNPFNVPFVMGELVIKLMDKLETYPLKIYTYNEAFSILDEIVPQLCKYPEQKTIKDRDIDFLILYLCISKN